MSKLTALWAYQEAEGRKTQIETAIRSTESYVKLRKINKLLKQQQANIQRLGEQVEEYAAQIAKIGDTTARLNDRIETENEELDIMRGDEESTAEEMAELRGDVEKIYREINVSLRDAKNLMQMLEKAVAEYGETVQTAKKAKVEYDRLRAVCEQERAASAGELSDCEKELEELRKNVDAALLARYEKLKSYHANPIAKVVNNKCGGCNMSIPMVTLKRLSTTDAIVECDNCGRLLYDVES